MRILVALVFVAACSGPTKKPEGTMVNEGSDTPSSCCCRSNPLTSEDGKPVFEKGTNRMECSSKQGTCVPEVQCNKTPEPSSVPPPPPAP